MEGCMENYSIDEVLEQAIQTETLGHELYLKLAGKFEKDEKLRQLFETLAAKENEHKKIFADLRDKVTENTAENWEEVSYYLRAIVESEFFLGRYKALPALDHLKNIQDAVTHAINFEKETVLYFLSLKDVVKEKDIIEQLINEEKSHIVWLSKYREAIKVAR